MATNTLTSHPIHTRPRRASSIWLPVLLDLIVAGVLLTFSARTMEAAPSLSASENPVIIPSGQSSKTIDVSWDADGLAKAILTIRDSNGATVVGPLSVKKTGQEPLTVVCRTSYTATLVDAERPRVVLASLVITTDCTGSRPTPPPDPKPKCPGDCFTGDKVEPHGTWARFLVATLTPVQLHVEVFPTKMDGSCDFTTSLGTVTKNGTATTHDLNWVGLAANTAFCSELRATDTGGGVHKKQGPTFTTLKRKIEVRFDKIFIVDDSDDGSEGDLYFAFGVFTGPNESSKSIEAEANTGQSVVFLGGQAPLAMFIEHDAPATLTLKVQGCDDDQPDIILTVGTGCTYVQLGFGQTGSDADADFNHVEKTFNHAAGPDESKPVTFELQTAGGALKFNVHGSFTATYQ